MKKRRLLIDDCSSDSDSSDEEILIRKPKRRKIVVKKNAIQDKRDFQVNFLFFLKEVLFKEKPHHKKYKDYEEYYKRFGDTKDKLNRKIDSLRKYCKASKSKIDQLKAEGKERDTINLDIPQMQNQEEIDFSEFLSKEKRDLVITKYPKAYQSSTRDSNIRGEWKRNRRKLYELVQLFENAKIKYKADLKVLNKLKSRFNKFNKFPELKEERIWYSKTTQFVVKGGDKVLANFHKLEELKKTTPFNKKMEIFNFFFSKELVVDHQQPFQDQMKKFLSSFPKSAINRFYVSNSNYFDSSNIGIQLKDKIIEIIVSKLGGTLTIEEKRKVEKKEIEEMDKSKMFFKINHFSLSLSEMQSIISFIETNNKAFLDSIGLVNKQFHTLALICGFPRVVITEKNFKQVPLLVMQSTKHAKLNMSMQIIPSYYESKFENKPHGRVFVKDIRFLLTNLRNVEVLEIEMDEYEKFFAARSQVPEIVFPNCTTLGMSKQMSMMFKLKPKNSVKIERGITKRGFPKLQNLYVVMFTETNKFLKNFPKDIARVLRTIKIGGSNYVLDNTFFESTKSLNSLEVFEDGDENSFNFLNDSFHYFSYNLEQKIKKLSLTGTTDCLDKLGSIFGCLVNLEELKIKVNRRNSKDDYKNIKTSFQNFYNLQHFKKFILEGVGLFGEKGSKERRVIEEIIQIFLEKLKSVKFIICSYSGDLSQSYLTERRIRIIPFYSKEKILYEKPNQNIFLTSGQEINKDRIRKKNRKSITDIISFAQ